MHRASLLLLFWSMAAVASPVARVICDGCTTLRAFGNFGAASLYRATGPMGPAVGNDRIWVDNPSTGNSVFVDVDTPMMLATIMGTQVPVPDVTKAEVNAEWLDGSASEAWVVSNEVLASMAASIEAAERHGTDEVSPDEVEQLPGLSERDVWSGVDHGSWARVSTGRWVFHHTDAVPATGTPVVTIIECVWEGSC